MAKKARIVYTDDDLIHTSSVGEFVHGLKRQGIDTPPAAHIAERVENIASKEGIVHVQLAYRGKKHIRHNWVLTAVQEGFYVATKFGNSLTRIWARMTETIDNDEMRPL